MITRLSDRIASTKPSKAASPFKPGDAIQSERSHFLRKTIPKTVISHKYEFAVGDLTLKSKTVWNEDVITYTQTKHHILYVAYQNLI
jgi:hypothetical protein